MHVCMYKYDPSVFKYQPGYNVKRVSYIGFKFCEGDNAMDTFTTGNDIVTLEKGYNNFISSIPKNACQLDGMKITILTE